MSNYKISKPPSNLRQAAFKMLERLTPAGRIEDSIIISGTGRSGSTWLGEIIRSMGRYKYLNEPFMHTSFTERRYVSPNCKAPEHIQNYIQNALRGRLGKSWRYKFKSKSKLGRVLELISNNRVVVKFTRAIRATQWMARSFNVRGTILLMRHPCAVVSSMLRHGNWSQRHMEWRGGTPEGVVLGKNLPDAIRERFRPHILGTSEQFETLAHMWALDYHLAFFDHSVQGYPWILVPYERLVTHGENELKRITNALGGEVNSEMEQRMSVASSSASQDLETKNSNQQLAKWKNHLSMEQIDRILEIAHLYDINWYGKSNEPKYIDINMLQQAEARW